MYLAEPFVFDGSVEKSFQCNGIRRIGDDVRRYTVR
jgi:hypothetical protein